MSNAISSIIFLGRNTDKALHGDVSRAPVAFAQAGSVVDKVARLDNTVGKSTSTAINSLCGGANSIGAKAIHGASKLVNPLLVASAGIRVAAADDKEAAVYKEGFAIGSMFAAEKAMKSKQINTFVQKHSDDAAKKIFSKAAATKIGKKVLTKYGDEAIEDIIKNASRSNNKFVKFAALAISGITFVAASIAGYDLGAKVGTSVVEKKRSKNNNSQENTASMYDMKQYYKPTTNFFATESSQES